MAVLKSDDEAATRRSVEMEHLNPHGTRFAGKEGATPVDDDDMDFDMQMPHVYSASEEKSVIKKLDRRVVLLIAFLYMLSFLDRSSKSPKFFHFYSKLPRLTIYSSRHWQCKNRWLGQGLEA
jgi:hypothetical protein